MTDHRPPPWLSRAVAAALAVMAVFLLATRDDTVQLGGDANLYLLHTENLVEGEPYAATGYIQNADRQVDPIAYPPGYPLMLAPVAALFGTGRGPMAVFQVLALLIAAGLFARLYWDDLSPPSVLALVVLIGLNPFLWRITNRAYSDLPFLAVAALALLLIERLRASEGGRAGYALALGAGLACAAAILVRVLGVALLPALAFAVLGAGWRRRLGPVALAFVIAGAVSVGTLQAVDWDAGGRVIQGEAASDGGYEALVENSFEAQGEAGVTRGAAILAGRVWTRAVDYGRMDRDVFWDPLTRARGVHLPLRALGFLVLLVGLARRARHPRVVDVFGAFYLLALLPWPFGRDRYLIPLLPVLYAALLTGVETLVEAVRTRRGAVRLGAALPLGAAAVLLGGFFGKGVVAGVGRLGGGAGDPYIPCGVELVMEHAPPDATVLTTNDPRIVAFLARRDASKLPRDTTAWDRFGERIDATHALTCADPAETRPWARRFGWQPVAHTPWAALYALDPAPPDTTAADTASGAAP